MKNYVTLSYPRSGASFTNYIISKAAKISYSFQNNKQLHYIKRNIYKPSKIDVVILLLRNYKECIIRHNSEYKISKINLNSELKEYFWGIEMFEKFEKEKCVIYYKDLIKNTENELLKLGKILDVDFSEIINNLKYYVEQSKLNYNKSDTKGCTSSNQIYYHRTQLSIEQKKDWDDIFKNYNSQLFNKYLKQYEYKT